MLPLLRTKLKGVSSRNVSLQDILRTCDEASKVTDVVEHYAGIHNTKLTLLLKDGEERVQFYNRIDIAKLFTIPFLYTGNVAVDIPRLNLLGFDFTEDDLEYVNGYLKAKDDSLGYFGITSNPVQAKVTVNPYSNLMVTENGIMSYAIELVPDVTSVLWSVDDINKLNIDPTTGEFTAVGAGEVTVTLTINELVSGSVTFEIFPYASIVEPINLTAIKA